MNAQQEREHEADSIDQVQRPEDVVVGVEHGSILRTCEANAMSGDDVYVSRSALQPDLFVPMAVISSEERAPKGVIRSILPIGTNLDNDFLVTTNHHPPLVAIARARIAYVLAISICFSA